MLQHCESRQFRVSMDVSDVIEKLREDYGPYERSEVLTTVVDDIDKDIEDHEREIDRLRNQLASLTTECDRLRSIKSKYLALTSPIRRLPNEILIRILEDYCHDNDFGSQSKLRASNHQMAALRASAVCSRWRMLALALPQIWSNITIELCADRDYNEKETQLIGLIRLFIQRSKDHPLSLRITTGWWRADANKPQKHPAWKILFACAHRWRSITVDSEWESPFELTTIMSTGPSQSLPLLERASLRQSAASDWDMRTAPFKDAPRLKELTLRGLSTVFDAKRFQWCQLTYLDLPVYTDCIFTILGLCSNLLTLKLAMEFDEEHTEERVPEPPELPVQLPALRSLYISLSPHYAETFDHCFHFIFPFLTTPSLEELNIVNAEFELGGWPLDEIRGFLVRSRCALSKLTLRRAILWDTELAALLFELPTVCELVIDESSIRPGEDRTAVTNLLLRRLSVSDGRQPLLPRLTQLTLAVLRTKENSDFDDLVVGMTLSRWVPDSTVSTESGIACLREVCLCFYGTREFDWEPYMALRGLEGAGMKLTLYSTEYTAS